ncbi:MAG: FeoB-associated Cys-rich membrane protein [Faecousia sp.]
MNWQSILILALLGAALAAALGIHRKSGGCKCGGDCGCCAGCRKESD